MKVALEFVSNITKFHKEFSHIDIVYVLFTLKVTAILIHSMHGFKSLPSLSCFELALSTSMYYLQYTLRSSPFVFF